MENATVREHIRRLLHEGQLSTSIPEWWCVGGYGTGRRCRVCTAPIAGHDIQVELDGEMVVHSGCYVAWKEEVDRYLILAGPESKRGTPEEV